MSAIFGIIDFEGRPIEKEWIKSMQTDLAHRGPEGKRIYQEESMFLGHMLLQVTPESIYDKSPYEEDGFVITANARLDERKAIMDRLNVPEVEREIITDPLLLLRSFRKFGKDFVKDIYGDFAFAIWDKEKKELFCARDQIGVKPFLYYLEDNRLVFSTELKSIVNLPIVETEIDNLILRNEAIGINDAPCKTVWKNIYRLKASHYLNLDKNQVCISKYWGLRIKQNITLKTQQDWASALKALIEKVISDHSRVLGEVGVPLSGGLDSSTIACIAARKFAKENKNIVSASSVLDKNFSKPGLCDEREYMDAILEQEKNIDATFVYHSQLKYSLEDLNSKFDDNYAPVVHSHYIDEAIFTKFKEKSVRRMLSGVLGDITISNSTVSPLPLLLLRGEFSKFHKLSKSFRKNMKLGYYTHLKRNIVDPILPFSIRRIIHSVLGVDKDWTIDKLPLQFQKKEQKSLQKRMNDLYKSYYINQLNIKNSIWPEQLENFGEDYDCNSSHHHVEITYPLIDRRIVEFMVQLPIEYFYMGGLKRGLIRKAMENILPNKNRLRFDKLPYSPAYKQINQGNLKIFNILLNEKPFKKNTERLLNTSILTNYLNKHLNNSNFTSNYWQIIDICIWIAFYSWTIDNETNEPKKNNKMKEKSSKKQWNEPKIKTELKIKETLSRGGKGSDGGAVNQSRS